MAQKISFQWKDDDYTDSINRHILGVIPYGLYAGFDPSFANGLILNLIHTPTGVDEVTVGLVRTAKLGKLVTQQGATVQEDAAISVGIESNVGQGFPRIDTIVVEHQYVPTEGGIPAIYKVIKGTNQLNPVPQALPFPEKQMAIGYLTVPAGMASLTDVGVSYEKTPVPVLGNSDKIMRTDKVQTSTARKQFLQQHKGVGVADYGGGDILILRSDRNYFLLGDYGAGYHDVKAIVGGFIGDVTTANTIEIYCGSALRLYNGNDNLICPKPIYVEVGETLKLECRNGVYFVADGGEVRRHGLNKLNGELAGNKGASNVGGGQIELDGNGNFYDITEAAGQAFSFISKRAVLRTGNLGAGAIVFLQVKLASDPTNLGITLNNMAGSTPANYKSIQTPTNGNIKLGNGDLLILVEDTDRWRLVSIIGTDKNIISLSTALDTFITLTNENFDDLDELITNLQDMVTVGFETVNERIDNLSIDILQDAKEIDIACNLEPNLILKGGLVTNRVGDFASGTQDISAGMAQIGGDIRPFPAYSGAYPVILEKHPTNPATMRWAAGPTDANAYVVYNPFTAQRLEYAVKRASMDVGDIKMSSVVDSNFAADGSGRWAQAGFRLANGNGGTVDMGGQVAIGFIDQPVSDPANPEWEYRTMLNTLGEKKHALTADENGPHTHSYQQRRAGSATGNAAGHPDNTLDPATTGSSGLGTPHENRQESTVMAFIQRVTYIPIGG